MDTDIQALPHAKYQPEAHLSDYQWRKGQSGNPSGKPNGIATLARELTNNGRTCLEFLLSVMLDSGERTRWRIDAAIELLNRGYGKPIQAVDVSAEGAQPLRIIIELPGEPQRDTITLTQADEDPQPASP